MCRCSLLGERLRLRRRTWWFGFGVGVVVSAVQDDAVLVLVDIVVMFECGLSGFLLLREGAVRDVLF